MKISNQIITIARKECADAVRNSLFLTLTFFLMLLMVVSILVASFAFKAQVTQYNVALAQLSPVQLKNIVFSPPAYYPLQMLRGTIEYMEIIGAIIALVLGYLSVAKEKGTNTSRLILTRPVTRGGLVVGKILGNSAIMLGLIFIIGIFTIISIWGIGHVAFSPSELFKLALVLSYTYIYLLFFFCSSAALTLLISDLPRALMLAFSLWLIFVLIIPQIGDTMDPDNQVPGGFFAYMHMTQDGQHAVIDHFKGYEGFRNTLEVMSIEKHYERLSFATLGIKTMYNDKSLGFIMHDKWSDLLVLLIFFWVGIGLFYTTANNRRIMGSSP